MAYLIVFILVILSGNAEQKKKYLGRLLEEPLLAAYCKKHLNLAMRQVIK